jgi:pimeloyl-ACP methyl ester carboxylesterase
MPETIVLIHGLWMTPRSWERWIERYSERGHNVIAPAWPGLEGEVEELRRDPSPIARVRIREILDHYDRIIRELGRPPIVMGHSFGGAFAQVLLDRGLGAAGVAIHAASTGVWRVPRTTLEATWPAAHRIFHGLAVSLKPDEFRYAFTNTLDEQESLAVYERYHVPGAGRVLLGGAFANVNPRSPLRVDFGKDDRAPLLVVGGAKDNLVPASLTRAAAKRYRKSKAITEYKEYPGRSHYTLGQDGWEEVADYALEWAMEQAASRTAP